MGIDVTIEQVWWNPGVLGLAWPEGEESQQQQLQLGLTPCQPVFG